MDLREVEQEPNSGWAPPSFQALFILAWSTSFR